MSFLDSLADRAGATRCRIGYPEAHESRTAVAMRLAALTGLIPVAIGNAEELADLDLPHTERVDVRDRDVRAAAAPYTAGTDYEGREDPLPTAVALLRAGLVDGVVAGAEASTAQVLRAGLKILGPRPGIRTVSSSFYMVLGNGRPGEDVLTFTDAAVVPDPTAEQLVEIAEAAVEARRSIVGDEPRVAFLSYSTRSSAGGASVEKMQSAIELFRVRCPGVSADGELQADAALDATVATRKAPDSQVAGRANVLVFPNLDAGNIAYKLVQRLGGAVALGPILQGLAGALNDLSRGAVVEDILRVSYITALMAKTA